MTWFQHAEERVRNGVIAYEALEKIKQNRADSQARKQFRDHAADLGYALLLKRYVVDPRTADAATIARAAGDTVPSVGPLFWSFRIMVALGFYFIALFAVAFWDASHYNFSHRWLLLQNCFLSFLLSMVTARAVLLLFNVIETNLLR